MFVSLFSNPDITNKIPVILSTSLGDGADGQVFAIDGSPNKVIKISIGHVELIDNYARNLKKVLDYLKNNSHPCFVRIYSHEELGSVAKISRCDGVSILKYNLYYYIMEKLNKISEDEKKVFHSIISHEDRNMKKNFSSQKLHEILLGLNRGLDFDFKKITFFCENLKNSPIRHYDIHIRNIMKDSLGNFKLIDLDRTELIIGD